MSRCIYLCFLAAAMLALSACASRQQGLFDFLELGDFSDNRVEVAHPGGPIAEPQIPPELLREAAELPEPAQRGGGEISYDVKIEFSGAELDKDLRKAISRSFTGTSLLDKLRRKSPTDPAGLEQRMSSDLDNARDVLHAFGFYAGDARGRLVLKSARGESARRRVYDVIITFQPGPRYHLGRSSISVNGPAAADGEIPKTLGDIGLPEGSPVLADNVLAAVSAVRDVFLSRGYPFAELGSARYFLDHDRRELEVEIKIESGDKALMGDLELRGPAPVRPKYFEDQQNWKPGKAWNQNVIDIYRERLRQTGLFASVEIYPSEELNHRGERNVVVEVVGALERTVGGALRFDSDLGFGVLGYWENRNITGNGDRLRFEAPIWEELQELAVRYRLPFFMRKDQDLIMSGGVLHEDNDSYKLLTAGGTVGLERQLGRYWSGTASVRGEGGQIEEVDKKERDYYMFGLPLTLTFDDTKIPLNATRGVRITLSAGPYYGYYGDYFSAIRTRLDARSFLPLLGDDTLILALRGVCGSLFMADADEVPPTIRYYSGGGGSVRGYEYRSLGPRNEDNDPLGGESLLEFSAELRWKVAGDWGLVLFTDGGMVYTDDFPNKDDDLRWGAGLGLRYYTPIGPLRFDVAFPLNKRSDDSSVQLYISIGQSF